MMLSFVLALFGAAQCHGHGQCQVQDHGQALCQGCLPVPKGFDVSFYSYPFGNPEALTGDWYFNGGYETVGSLEGSATDVTDISYQYQAGPSLFLSPSQGTIYGQTIDATNFGAVFSGFLYAEQSGKYEFQPALHGEYGSGPVIVTLFLVQSATLRLDWSI